MFVRRSLMSSSPTTLPVVVFAAVPSFLSVFFLVWVIVSFVFLYTSARPRNWMPGGEAWFLESWRSRISFRVVAPLVGVTFFSHHHHQR